MSSLIRFVPGSDPAGARFAAQRRRATPTTSAMPATCAYCGRPRTRTSRSSTTSRRAGRRLDRGAVSAQLPRREPQHHRDRRRRCSRTLAATGRDRRRGAGQGAAGQGPDLAHDRRRRADLRRASSPRREVQSRIERCWRPYHAAVAAAIDAAHARHGYSIHINCHSMPADRRASYATDFPGLVHADFVIGDRDGTTAAPRAVAHGVRRT